MRHDKSDFTRSDKGARFPGLQEKSSEQSNSLAKDGFMTLPATLLLVST
jgi:hypothetical protein